MRFLILFLFLLVIFAFIDILFRSIGKIFNIKSKYSRKSKETITDAEYEVIDDED